MNEVNFSVRISPERSKKIDVHLAKKGKSKTRFVEDVIDNIPQVQKALDSTCSLPATKAKAVKRKSK